MENDPNNPFFVDYNCEACHTYLAMGGPTHNGWKGCRSGAIAAGGTRSHCSCDTCF